MGFVDIWCGSCAYETWDPDSDEGEKCDVLNRALLLDVGDPEYPSEWVYDDEKGPMCTKWTDPDELDPYAPPGEGRRCPNTLDLFE